MQQHKPLKIWYQIKRKQKVVTDYLCTAFVEDVLGEALTEACQELDLERPIVLPKHKKELEQFRRVVFIPRDFIGDFPFDTLEIDCIAEKQEDTPWQR